MRVFVAGATGVVGRRLVPQLVAQAHHATATNPGMVEQQATGVFNIVDDEPAPASEWLPYLAARASAKPPLRVATWLAGEVAVTVMTEGRGFSNAKAKRELGWELRSPSWRQGFRKELA